MPRRPTRADLRRAWRGNGRDTDNPPRKYEAKVRRKRRPRVVRNPPQQA